MKLRSARGVQVGRALLVAACALLTAVGPGCSPSEPEPAARTPLRLVTWKPNQPELWQEVYRRFEERNPDLELVVETGPHSSSAFHDLLTQKLKNRSRDVDVFLMDVIWPPEFGAAGWAEPLDPRFTGEQQAQFVDGTVLANRYRDRIYGVPLYLASGVLYYRSDLLAAHDLEPPTTWQELVAQANRITAGEGGDLHGYSGQFKQYEGLVCDMLEFVLSNGGRVIDPETRRAALAEPAAVAAVRFVQQELIGKVAPRGVLTYQEPESLDLFVQGKAVFHRNWPYAWNVAQDPDRSRVAGKVGIAPVPHFPGGTSRPVLGGWQVGISAFSEHKDAAWRLVEFLTSAEVQKLLALEGGLAPTRSALYEDPDILARHPQFESMQPAFATAHPRPRTPLYPALSNVLQRYFSAVIADPEADVAAAAQAAAGEIDELLALERQGRD